MAKKKRTAIPDATIETDFLGRQVQVRRELRKLASGIKIEDEEIVALLREGVLKRDVVEGDDAAVARTKVQKLYKAASASKPKPKTHDEAPPPETAPPAGAPPPADPLQAAIDARATGRP